MPKSESTPEELAGARPARVAEQRRARQERYVHFLQTALSTRNDNDLPPGKLTDVIQQGVDELESLTAAAGGSIFPRRRPPPKEPSDTCTIYIDECGDHSITSKDPFNAFCLAGVIIPDSVYPDVDKRWRRWKHKHLGSEHKRVHEPDIRRSEKSFWCGGDTLKRQRAVRELPIILTELPFMVVACVINRAEYAKEFGKQPLDESLPQHAYLMVTHFLLERVAMALYSHFDGAKGRLVIESRGPKEDAAIQYEFARLFLDGSVGITLDTYSHAIPAMDAEAAVRVMEIVKTA